MALSNTVAAEKPITGSNLTDQTDLESIKLKTRDDIHYLLKKIHAKHSLLSVTIEPYEDFYGSTIIEINKTENYLVIDELYPEEGHKIIKVGSELSFNTQYSGAFVYFKGSIEAIGENNKAAYYKINIPEELEYHQRRNTYRIATGVNNIIPVNLVNEDEILIKGELRDLSHGGLCLRFNSLAPHISFKSNDYIPTCLIQFEDNRKILSSLNICHVEQHEDSGIIRVGAEFAHISKTDRRELEHLIASLERAIIQKIKRTDNITV